MFFVLLRFGSVVHPCCYKLSKVLALFNDNIYKVHIISYSKSCITSMVISTEGSEFFFFLKAHNTASQHDGNTIFVRLH